MQPALCGKMYYFHLNLKNKSDVQTGKKIHFINAFISLDSFRELEKRFIFPMVWNGEKGKK